MQQYLKHRFAKYGLSLHITILRFFQGSTAYKRQGPMALYILVFVKMSNILLQFELAMFGKWGSLCSVCRNILAFLDPLKVAALLCFHFEWS